MSSQLQANLQGDFDLLIPRSREFAEEFYSNLFNDAPALRPLFEGVDMTSQGQMLLQALGFVIQGIDQMEELSPVLENLGYRHVEYGVKKKHYPLAVDAIISTFRQFLGNDLTASKEQDWRDALNLVTKTMISGIDRVTRRLDEERNTEKDDFSPIAASTDDYLSRFVSEANPDENIGRDESSKDELPKKFTVEFAGEKKIDAAPLQTLYQIALQNGIPHIAECGAKAKCTTCRVMVLDGLEHCLPRNIPERKMAQLKGFAPEVRLGCQTRVTGPVTVRRLVLDKEDASEASEAGINSAGRELPLAVMFADIRGFTKISSQHLPYDIIHALNRYFRVVCGEIDQRHGYVDKYIGDGLMVIFGLSTDREVHPCVDAVHAAIGMQRRMPELNKYLAAHLNMDFRIGVGIHYGPVVVGELGFPPKKQFTAIGDVVNVSARIEGKCKEVGSGILISESVRSHVAEEGFSIDSPVSVSLAGKDEPVLVLPVNF